MKKKLKFAAMLSIGIALGIALIPVTVIMVAIELASEDEYVV